jgi:hypothetical protein
MEDLLVGVKLAMRMEGFGLVHPISPMQMEAMPSPLSSRPERSVVQGSVVRPSDFPNSHVNFKAVTILARVA